MIRIAHVWSSDAGLVLSLPYLRPLVARGWEVYGICPPGPSVAAVQAEGVHWLPHPIERRRNPRTDLVGAITLVRYFRKFRFDIVHTHNAKVGVIARLAATIAGTPVILHTHHGVMFSGEASALERIPIAALERLCSVRVDRVLAQSQEDFQTLVRSGAAAQDRIERIGNGVNLSRFHPGAVSAEDSASLRRSLGVKPEEILFLSAGRLVQEKGFVELFEAARLAAIKDPRVRLAVAGEIDSEKADAVEPATVERARENGVLLLGERADMVALYAAADAVVLASWREGLPRVLMEGAAMGKPLLATDVRGCREVVKPGGGFLARVRDPRALADAMLRVAADPDLRAQLGRYNDDCARREFDLGRVVARVEALYAALLARKGLPRV